MIHAANVEKSPRLQRVLYILERAGCIGVTSLDLQNWSRTVAPGTCVSELRRSGYLISCDYEQTTEDGARVYRYTMKGRTNA